MHINIYIYICMYIHKCMSVLLIVFITATGTSSVDTVTRNEDVYFSHFVGSCNGRKQLFVLRSLSNGMEMHTFTVLFVDAKSCFIFHFVFLPIAGAFCRVNIFNE